MTSPGVSCVISEGVARIVFDRPDRLNALNIEMANGFLAAVRQACGDESVRVVVLSGVGRAFVAGGDLSFLRDAKDRQAAARALIEPMHEALLMLHEHAVPTIAAVKGPVAGAGMSLALFADFAVAADDATLNMAYIRVATSPDCGGSWSLTRLVGQRKAVELALLADAIDAPTALKLGLVTQVVATDKLDEAVAALSARLAAGPPAALRATKALLVRALGVSLEDQLKRELNAFVTCAGTSDFGEALDAFFEKRSPSYRG